MKSSSYSTPVQYPRFEKARSDWRTDFLASQQPWLSPVMWEALCNPLGAGESVGVDIRKQTQWNGVFQKAKMQTTPERSFWLPADLGESVYRSRTYHHYYEWDEQSLPGESFEVVLETRADDGTTGEVAALLARYSDCDLQRYVINDAKHGWHEPTAATDRSRAESYLFYLCQLANTPAERER